ncbi:hypothetical protein Tco_0555966 [Tanacetum coccineum]
MGNLVLCQTPKIAWDGIFNRRARCCNKNIWARKRFSCKKVDGARRYTVPSCIVRSLDLFVNGHDALGKVNWDQRTLFQSLLSSQQSRVPPAKKSLDVEFIKETLGNDEPEVGSDIVKRALGYPMKLIAKNADCKECWSDKSGKSSSMTKVAS